MKKLICTVVLSILTVCEAQANMVTNGNFANGAPTGWTVTGVAGIGPYAGYGMSGTYAGSLYGAIYGFGNQSASGVLSQTISTVSGASYVLSFAYGSFSGNPALTQSMFVTATDTATSGVLLSQNISTTSSGTTLATVYTLLPTYTFTATGSSTTLSFTDTSANTIGVDAFLANVSLTNLTNLGASSVPEPCTTALVGIGIIGLLFLRNKPSRI